MTDVQAEMQKKIQDGFTLLATVAFAQINRYLEQCAINHRFIEKPDQDERLPSTRTVIRDEGNQELGAVRFYKAHEEGQFHAAILIDRSGIKFPRPENEEDIDVRNQAKAYLAGLIGALVKFVSNESHKIAYFLGPREWTPETIGFGFNLPLEEKTVRGLREASVYTLEQFLPERLEAYVNQEGVSIKLPMDLLVDALERKFEKAQAGMSENTPKGKREALAQHYAVPMIEGILSQAREKLAAEQKAAGSAPAVS